MILFLHFILYIILLWYAVEFCRNIYFFKPELYIIRPIVFEEVNKIINCGNPDYGYALYVCEHCGNFLKVPFRCKSRFCNTCGVKYAQDRALSMAKKIYSL